MTCSLDRTVAIGELVDDPRVYGGKSPIIIRTIHLSRAHAVDIQYIPDSTILLVSTSDRQVQVFDMSTGENLSSYKATADSTDLISLSAVDLSNSFGFPPVARLRPSISPNSPQSRVRKRKLLGAGANDKSVRIYDHDTGTLLATKWAHAESITGLIWLDDSAVNTSSSGSGSDQEDLPQQEQGNVKQSFVTVGVDGCVITWELQVVPKMMPVRFSPRNNPVLRMRKSFEDGLLRYDRM